MSVLKRFVYKSWNSAVPHGTCQNIRGVCPQLLILLFVTSIDKPFKAQFIVILTFYSDMFRCLLQCEMA